ncbi:protein-glutamate methylesterase/protein-glutamine glutaminase [Clostridium tagluense]|uniref:protein-glutamate methylesterase/protein-glutamine glutaminase n=1 Tax=Clostridium tagluense TaxID=360422 RepID=UPI001CF27475|nr:chemotaxis response regulator protein-glutamate methylesterase [Clostridium tagluense]MCB2297380.1 chemotaxis response regulator protein-glutamate methylesterase [Clostridium tagluense]
MKQYGVLVVDDSAFMRRCISLIIEKDPEFFIIGIARDGIDAVEKVKRLKPDLVTMDVEMPGMDGISALKEIIKTCPVPVVMLSNHTEKGTKTTLEALEIGAVDFFLKSSLIGEEAKDNLIDEFVKKIKVIASSGKVQHNETSIEVGTTEGLEAIKSAFSHKRDLLIIGCSTGGPSALQSILPRFPKELPVPIIVIQHMPPGFTGPLAERFDTICSLHVKEIENGDVLEVGNIYIAPAGFQTFLEESKDNKITFKVDEVAPIDTLYKPSIDVTLNSAAPILKSKLVCVILTGMGNDGLMGCGNVKENNGYVIVEAEESCIVYGMPKVVFEAGLADIQVPLPRIFEQIMLHL